MGTHPAFQTLTRNFRSCGGQYPIDRAAESSSPARAVASQLVSCTLSLLRRAMPHPNVRTAEFIGSAREAGSQLARRQMLFYALGAAQTLSCVFLFYPQ